MEAAISSSIPPDKKLLVLSNGDFGTRLYEIAQLHKIETILVEKPWAGLFDIEEIEEKLKLDKEISAIAMNHHETSVGLLNPVHEVGRLAGKYNKMLIVDAVSSLGAEKLDVIIELNSILKSELSRLGFEFLTDDNCESHSILTVKVPEDIDFEKLYSSLKERGFLVYRCKHLLKDKYFQIANMGAPRRGMLYDFIFSVEYILDRIKEPDKRK